MLGVSVLAEGTLNDLPPEAMSPAEVSVEVMVSGWLTLSAPTTLWSAAADIEINHDFTQIAIRAET